MICRRSPVGAPGRGVRWPILRCADRCNLPRRAHQLASPAMISRNQRKITTTQRTAAHSVTAGGCGQTPPRRSTAPPGADRTSIQTRTQTWSCRISAGNRCTPCPRIVEQRPSSSLNRQRCKGQTTSPSSIQPWPSEPPACGQRSVRAIIVSPARKTARRRPRTSQVRPRPAGISSIAAHQDPIGHDTWHSRRQPGWKTASLGLASEASTTGRFYGNDRLSPNVLEFLILGTNWVSWFRSFGSSCFRQDPPRVGAGCDRALPGRLRLQGAIGARPGLGSARHQVQAGCTSRAWPPSMLRTSFTSPT